MGAAKQIKVDDLKAKALWVRTQTLLIHKRAPETRVASSLSTVEVLTAMYYGGILQFDPKKPYWEGRDRFIISKGHGSIAMYPILADHGFFEMGELENVCKEGSFLGGVPDPIIPGYETINGSLGHGLGVGCGMALALREQKNPRQVYVMTGDGELNEGSIWEALMFASHHQLGNLTIIVDKNQKCMLDYTSKVINMDSLAEKFKAFGCLVDSVDGHDVNQVHERFKKLQSVNGNRPRVLIAETLKGKGVPKLEASPLCHVTGLTGAEIDDAIAKL